MKKFIRDKKIVLIISAGLVLLGGAGTIYFNDSKTTENIPVEQTQTIIQQLESQIQPGENTSNYQFTIYENLTPGEVKE